MLTSKQDVSVLPHNHYFVVTTRACAQKYLYFTMLFDVRKIESMAL